MGVRGVGGFENFEVRALPLVSFTWKPRHHIQASCVPQN
jgi:hypothetical protein